MNNRGFIGDAFIAVLIIFAVATGIVFTSYALNKANDAISTANVSQEGKDLIAKGSGDFPGAFDAFLAILFIGFPLVAAGLAFFLDVNSVFFWILFLISFIIIIAGAAISKLWNTIFGASSELTAAANNFAITNWIMNHYALYALFSISVIIGGFYFRMRSGGNYYV